MAEPAPPFGAVHSPDLPELLRALRCTLALTTHQAGKLVFVSARDEDTLIQLPRSFERAMALGADGDRLAVATQDEVVVLANAPGLAARYPRQPDVYDALFVPRATYYTGRVDVHGLAWGAEGLWAAVTAFSCLALVTDGFSFVPRWRPRFVSALAPEDRCHLNGMALEGGAPRWVTALGDGDAPQSWRARLPRGGVLVDVPSGEVVLADLPMPHSPRVYDGALYLLLSATGEIVRVDPAAGKYDVVNRVDGFVRGLARAGDYLFVGRSRLRKNASAFRALEVANRARTSGVTVIHLATGAIVSELTYRASVEEIFDVQVLPGLRRPGLLGTREEAHRLALSLPEATYWAVTGEKDRSTSAAG